MNFLSGSSTGNPPGGYVVCAGLYASGSTWAFNAAKAIVRRVKECAVTSVYTDDLEDAKHALSGDAGWLVLKTHNPGAPVRDWGRKTGVPIIMTVRDPRDAVASMMGRFGCDFHSALAQVVTSASHVLFLRERSTPLVLKYEQHFTGRRGISLIARHLNLKLSVGAGEELAQELSASAVARHISALVAAGIFEGADPAHEWEPDTHWHPNHVGDGRIGKFPKFLNAAAAAEVLYRTEPFCEAFGYQQSERSGSAVQHPARNIALEGHVDDFVPPNLVLGWARSSPAAVVRVEAFSGDRFMGHADANRFRPDLAGDRDGHVGFVLELPCEVHLGELLQSVVFAAYATNGTRVPIELTATLKQRALAEPSARSSGA